MTNQITPWWERETPPPWMQFRFPSLYPPTTTGDVTLGLRPGNIWRRGLPQGELPIQYWYNAAYRPQPWQGRIGYWENPQRIARYHQVAQARPPGTSVPDWYDEDLVGRAHTALAEYNGGQPWWNWQPLPYNHPLTADLSLYPPPPEELQFPGERAEIAATTYAPTPAEALANPALGGFTQAEYDQLPYYRKMLIWLTGSPAGQAAIMAAPTAAVLSAALSPAVGIPVGAAIGGYTYMATQEAQRAAVEQREMEWWASAPMLALNYLFEQMERGLGITYQVYGAISEPEKYGTLGELLEQLPAASQAARVSYEAGLPPWLTAPAAGGMALAATRNIPAAIITGAMASGVSAEMLNVLARVEMSATGLIGILAAKTGSLELAAATVEHLQRLKLAERGEVFVPGKAEPVPLDAPEGTLAMLTQLRHEIFSNPDIPPSQIVEFYIAKYGLSGQTRELLAGFMLDPFEYVVGGVARPAAKGIAKLLDRPLLARAVGETGGLFEAARYYGMELRGLPTEEIAGLSRLERWLYGYSPEGLPKYLAEKPVGGVRGLFQLTPFAQATTITSRALMNLSELLANSDSPETSVKYLHAMAQNPAELAQQLNMQSVLSPDAIGAQIALRDKAGQSNVTGLEKVDSHLAVWAANASNRILLENVANATNQTIPELLRSLVGDETQADALLQQYINAARQSGDPAARALVQQYDARATLPPEQQLTGRRFVELFRTFVREKQPWSLEMWNADLVAMVSDHIQDWAASWFGLKPDNALVRFGALQKSIQSILLLRGNPAQFVQNLINGWVTMAFEGVLGMSRTSEMMAWWDRMGTHPPRLRAGFGPTALGTETSYAALRKAVADKSWMGLTTRVLHENNWLKKILFFGEWTAKTEGWQRMNAMTVSARKFWAKNWQVGRGVQRMPTALDAALRAQGLDPQQTVYAAILGGMTGDEIMDAVFAGATRMTLEAGLQAATGHLGAETGALAETLQAIGAYDRLAEAARTDADAVRTVLNEIRQEARAHLAGLEADALAAEAEQAMLKIRAEGLQAVPEMYQQMWVDFIKTEWSTRRRWWDFYARYETMDAAQRGVLARKLRYEDQADWRAFYDRQQATYDGMLRALGTDSPEARQILAHHIAVRDEWLKFHDAKGKMLDDFFAGEYPNRQARDTAWHTLQQTLQEMYAQAGSVETQHYTQADALFAEMVRAQMGEAQGRAAAAWREQARAVRESMLLETEVHFANALEMPNRDRRTYLNRYFTDDNVKAWADKFRAEMEGLAAWNQAAAATTPEMPPPPTIALMITRDMRQQLADLGYTVADINTMRPEDAHRFIADQITKPLDTEFTPVDPRATLPDDATMILTRAGETMAARPSSIAEVVGEMYAIAATPELIGNYPLATQERGGVNVIVPEHFFNAIRAYSHHPNKARWATLEDIAAEPNARDIVSAALAERLAVHEARDAGLSVEEIPAIPVEQVERGLIPRARGISEISLPPGAVDVTDVGPEVRQAMAVIAEREHVLAAADVPLLGEGNPREILATYARMTGASEAAVETVLQVQDARARTFARDTGLTPDDYYRRLYGGAVMGGEGALFQARQGAVTFQADGRAILHAFQTANLSTLLHEGLGHLWRRDLWWTAENALPEYKAALQADLQTVAQFVGFDTPDDFINLEPIFNEYRALQARALTEIDAARLKEIAADALRYEAAEEKFAQAVEQYFREGIAPSAALARAFERFKRWLLSIYTHLGIGDYPLSDEIRRVFDRMLAEEADTMRGAIEGGTAEGAGPLFDIITEGETYAPRPAEPVPTAAAIPEAAPPATGPETISGVYWDDLARRGAVGNNTATALATRAARDHWPDDFQQALGASLEQLPPAVRDALEAHASRQIGKPLFVLRPNLDDVPPELRGAFEVAAAVAVNHLRIEFMGDKPPTPEVLRHELVHYLWYDLYPSWRAGKPGARTFIDTALSETAQAGREIIDYVMSAEFRAKERPEGIDPFIWMQAKDLRRLIRKYGQYGGQLSSMLELELMIGGGFRELFQRFGRAGTQFDLITLYLGIADRGGVKLSNDYAFEEVIAYRAGEQADFAERLFAALRPAERLVEVQPVMPGVEEAYRPAWKPLEGGEVPQEGLFAPPEAVVAPAAPKEPWQMAREEWHGLPMDVKEKYWPTQPAERPLPYHSNFHRYEVEQALREGKPVPPEVLADYPDLAAPAGAKPAPTAPPEAWQVEALADIQRRGTARIGNVDVKIVRHPSGDGWAVETTVSGDRRYPIEPPMTMEEAQQFAVSQLENPRPTQTVVPETRDFEPGVIPAKKAVPRTKANAAELAADYKARGMDRYRAWSEFVKDRDLQPEIDAKEFYSLYEQVAPARYVGDIPAPRLSTLFQTSPWFDTEGGPRRVIGSADPNILYQTDDGATQAFNPNGPPPEAVRAPLGSADELRLAPDHARIQGEGWNEQILPLLDELEAVLTSPEAARAGGDVGGLDAETQRQLRVYLAEQIGRMADVKLMMMRWAENQSDAALLNYGNRYGIDNYTQLLYPYNFWYTRSALYWAARMLDHPGWMANWARLRRYQSRVEREEGYPRRLQGKVKWPFVPFLPEWAGGGIYWDPMRQFFPVEQFMQPWKRMSEERNLADRRAVFILQQRAEDGEIGAQEAYQAIQTRQGALWENARAQAELEIDAEIQNPLDFVNTLVGPSMPFQWAYYGGVKGEPERMGITPLTRMIQFGTGLVGINQGRGLNIEGPIRRALSLPEIDRFYDYRVDRMLATLAAEGEITAEDAQRAMIERQGPAFLLSQQRVAAGGRWTYIGAPFGADLFPEGEQKQRSLAAEYDKARDAWLAGGEYDDTIGKFFDEFPEYEARLLTFKDDPQEKLRTFLRAEIWDKYLALPGLHKRQVSAQLGDLFTQSFLDKETRNYDSINTETLTYWARALKGYVPTTAAAIPQLPDIELASPEIAQAYEQYGTEKRELFPDIGRLYDALYRTPEAMRAQFRQMYPQINEYERWKNAWLAKYPDLIPYVTGEAEEISPERIWGGGALPLETAPQEIRALVYRYRAERDTLFPNIFDTQSRYFTLDKAGRKQFLKDNPQLAAYWDWQRQFFAAFPPTIPYIRSIEAIAEDVLGEGGRSERSVAPATAAAALDLSRFPAAMLRQLVAYALRGEPLTGGALRLLRLEHERAGGGMPFDNWLEQVVYPSVGVR